MGWKTECLNTDGTQPNDSDSLNKSWIQGPIVVKASIRKWEGRISWERLEILRWSVIAIKSESDSGSNCWKPVKHSGTGSETNNDWDERDALRTEILSFKKLEKCSKSTGDYLSEIAYIIQWDSLCLDKALPLAGLTKQTNNSSQKRTFSM